jgi:hypothetical protein
MRPNRLIQAERDINYYNLPESKYFFGFTIHYIRKELESTIVLRLDRANKYCRGSAGGNYFFLFRLLFDYDLNSRIL